MKPKTKSEKLRLAANIIWLIGVTLTTNFVLSGSENLSLYWVPVVFIICIAVQYVVTEIESALFSGVIPTPWHETSTAKTKWIWCSAVIVTILDLFVNIGGVGYVAKFLVKSSSGDILKSEFGASDEGLKLISSMMILTLAFLVAVGPELLKMYADIIEPTAPFQEVKTVVTPYVDTEKLSSDMHKFKRPAENDLPLNIQESLNAARSNAALNLQKRKKHDR